MTPQVACSQFTENHKRCTKDFTSIFGKIALANVSCSARRLLPCGLVAIQIWRPDWPSMSKTSRARRVKSKPGWSASLANSLKRLSMETSLTTGDVSVPSSMQTFSEIYCFDINRSQSTFIKTLGLPTSHLEQAKRWNKLHNLALQWFDIVVWRYRQFWLGSNASDKTVVVFLPRLADGFYYMSCCDFVDEMSWVDKLKAIG